MKDLDRIAKSHSNYRLKHGSCLAQMLDTSSRSYCSAALVGDRYKCPFLDKSGYSVILSRVSCSVEFKKHYHCSYVPDGEASKDE